MPYIPEPCNRDRTAVSYTHLDVYKRQDEIRNNEREQRKMEKKLLQSQINPHFLYNTLAVSYTHLDVYKRQCKIVLTLCATITIDASCTFSFNSLRSAASVFISSAEKLSSNTSTFAFFAIALAIARRCFCPPDTLLPPWAIGPVSYTHLKNFF